MGEQYNKTFRKEMKKHKSVVAKYRKTGAYKAFLEKKKAKKFGKKPKDQNAPKRPSTAFFVFANTIRSDIDASNPEASIGQIGKILGQAWQNLDESEKQSYQAKAAENKEKYAEVLAKYKETKNYTDYQETLTQWKKAKKAFKKGGSTKKRVVKRRK